MSEENQQQQPPKPDPTQQIEPAVPKLDLKPEKKEPKLDLAPKLEPKPEPEKKTPKALGGDDDEIPEDTEILTLKPSDLKRRLERARKSELKERFGTTDVAAIQKDLEELKTLRAERDKRKEKTKTEAERAKSEAEKEKRLRLQAERERDQIREEVVVEKQEKRVADIASKHVDPDYVDLLYGKFAKHLLETYSDEELASLKDNAIEKWFKDYVADHPKFAREQKVEKPKVKLSNGGGPNGDGPDKAGPPKKTFKPGQPNSYTDAEAKAERRRLGIDY